MQPKITKKIRCAIYTRKSSEEGLEQSFNSLDAQREACVSYIKSQQQEGWVVLPAQYDDGGFSGGSTERPALKQLLEDIKARRIDTVVVYKVDRLSRSLSDFVRLIELFEAEEVSFVSVTQQFNTSSSMGRLTLNVLLSFAQFEREVTGERIRDKIAASKKKGMWMGGNVPLGYDVVEKTLVVNEIEAEVIRHIFDRYLALGCVKKLKEELDAEGYVGKERVVNGDHAAGKPFSRGTLYALLKNPIYMGKVAHQGNHYEGQHAAILDPSLWEQTQAQLASNLQAKQRRSSVKDPSLLAGLLFDDNGHRMSPTHTHKGKQRYRYYVSQAVLLYKESEGGSVLRIAAQKLERLVLQRIKALLQNDKEVIQLVCPDQLSAAHLKNLIQQADTLGDTWDRLMPQEHIDYLKRFVEKIKIGDRGIEITLFRHRLVQCLLTDQKAFTKELLPEDDNLVIAIAARFKRSGKEMKFIVGDEPVYATDRIKVTAIQSALGQALEWQEAILSGAIASTTKLAAREHVTQRYLAQILRLAALAPDIMASIFKGHIPPDLTLLQLKKGFPLDWGEQRRVLGFTT